MCWPGAEQAVLRATRRVGLRGNIWISGFCQEMKKVMRNESAGAFCYDGITRFITIAA